MSITGSDDSITSPTQFLRAGSETYAYRRFGQGSGASDSPFAPY